MSRIRTLKPEFFRSKPLARCSRDARLTFQGLWCEADDFGRGDADPRVIKGSVWPLDDDISWQDTEGHLGELEREGCIITYEVDGNSYYLIPSWEKHQSAAYRRGKAIYPEPTQHDSHDEECKNVQAARPEVLEQGTGNEELERGTGIALAPRARPTDTLWNAIVQCWNIAPDELTDTERGRLNKAVKLLKDVGAEPGEVPRRRARYRIRYPDAADTPLAVIGRWSELRTDNNGQGAAKLPAGADMTARNVERMRREAAR